MKKYKKTLLGSLIAFFVGISCCWLTSLAIWVGGISFMSVLISFIEEVQILLLVLGVILLLVSVFLYWKRKGRKRIGEKM